MEHFNANGERCAIITNIQKYTIHDGPGIRTEFFFKGCPLHCPWCSNPETIDPRPQIGVYPSKCMGSGKCGWCLDACPLGKDSPIRFDENDELLPLKMVDECYDCLKCAEACPGGGLKIWGETYTLDQLMKIAEEDRSFYERSGGGVTLSGGDVTMQWEIASDFVRECHEAGINTCVETEAFCPPEHLDALLEFADLVIFDIKHMDSAKHKEIFGVPNELILSNIERTAKSGKRIVIRTPVVAGYNADDDNIRATAAFIKDKVGSALVQYQLLLFRKMGVEKLDSLGLPYPLEDYDAGESDQRQAELERLRDMVADEFGIEVAAGSEGKLPL
jgi:pyruvate formate lyase activating enzyme